ncbi:hypothetical protein [Actinomadura rugatobispora]|uniref:Uncharacterized protein n=1 Tax=Actinomadura rugatobispora TaxID=1994 RepID=A0ABW0ZQ17_9ACTN
MNDAIRGDAVGRPESVQGVAVSAAMVKGVTEGEVITFREGW